jgi:hypothetical protein
MAEAGREMICPTCGATLPVLAGYSAWCDQCGWNLMPRTRPASNDPLDRADSQFERQFSASAFEAAQGGERKTSTPSRAYVIATAVHLSTLAFGATGFWLVVRIFTERDINAFGVALSLIIGIGLMLMAFWVQPIFHRRGIRLFNQAHPALFALADQLADDMNRPRLGSLQVDDSFSIGGGRVGLPLLAVLDAPEFSAALALAIARNDANVTANGWVASAIYTLHRWEAIMTAPGTSNQRIAVRAGITTVVETSRGDVDPWAAMSDGIFTRLALLPRSVAAALMSFNWQQTQMALYQADMCAARTAGSDALEAALVKTRWNYIAIGIMHKAVRTGLKRADGLFDALRTGLTGVPEREHERVRRTAVLEETMIERGEPPLGWRLRRLHTLNAPARVACDEARLSAIRTSLRQVEPAIAQKLLAGLE